MKKNNKWVYTDNGIHIIIDISIIKIVELFKIKDKQKYIVEITFNCYPKREFSFKTYNEASKLYCCIWNQLRDYNE